MKTASNAIQLSNRHADERLVKTVALTLFRGVRTLADLACQIPAVATQAAQDVAEAWEESSRPNA